MGEGRCDLCSHEPCRGDAAKDKRGVCSITADGMAMRMMLLRNVMGASSYHYHTELTIKTLKATVAGETPFAVREADKLLILCSRLGLPVEKGVKEAALALCDHCGRDYPRQDGRSPL